ncbi:MAG: BrnT family toxin [Planctomycetota bacterium]
MRFEWDPAKNAQNRSKHGVSFEEASTLFTASTNWLDLDDEAHSDDELRYRAVGPIARGIVLVVYVERDEDVIRIISARRATPGERRLYADWIARNP